MKRFTTILGAATTAGGKVITASSAISINGTKVALEGDKVFCPACKSEGKIKCDGPRLSETYCGKNVSLDGDLCICACPTPPRLIAAQESRKQIIEGQKAADWAKAFETMKAVHGTEGNAQQKGKALFVDEHSSRPVNSTSYSASGGQRRAIGVTDRAGTGDL